MDITFWTTAAPALSAAFFASLVEFVEAFTILLAVSVVDGWRPAVAGGATGIALLAFLVVMLGPALELVPLHLLQLVIGLLLTMFGTRWLRKAILRAAGVIPLHDEIASFAAETALLRRQAPSATEYFIGPGALTAFKAVVLEGLEVVFIVIAVGAGHNLLWSASLGAIAALALVLAMGVLVHRPLSRTPENTLKFGVGILLSAFGVFWSGEGLGIAWKGGDWSIIPIAGLFLLAGLAVVGLRRQFKTRRPA